jgi:hypothetical protein
MARKVPETLILPDGFSGHHRLVAYDELGPEGHRIFVVSITDGPARYSVRLRETGVRALVARIRKYLRDPH